MNALDRAGAARRTLTNPPRGYRPALDGLRALAVLAVIAYHLGYRWAKGGFLGVDLFFVLSGYLITSILVDELTATHRIDFLNFWAHRIKRLLPALLILLATIALATRVLLPETDWPFREADLLWALFYAANWHFILSQQDYFAQFVGESALRHLWSLAIEEQFYLVWPIVLAVLGLGNIVRWRTVAIFGGAALASAVSMFLFDQYVSQSRAYYGTDARAQELLIGALLCIAMRLIPSIARPAPRVAMVAGTAAFGVVLLAFVLLPDSSRIYYVGGAFAFSVLVALVLWTVELHPGQPMAAGLSWFIPRWIGQISYGLYLWHWPAIVLTPRLVQQILGPHADVLLAGSTKLNLLRLAVTFAAATASFYLVERPIRRMRHQGRLTNLRVALAVPPALAAMTALVLLVGQVPASDIALVQHVSDCPDNNFVCLVSHAGPADSPVMVLMGDSVAKSMDPAFVQIAAARKWTYIMAARNGCSMIQRWVSSDTEPGTRRPGWDACYNVLPEVYNSVLAARPNLIVATDRWLLAGSLDDSGKLLYPGSPEHLADTERRLADWARKMTATGSKLVLIHLLPIGRPIDCANSQFASSAPCQQKVSDDTLTPKYNAVMDDVAASFPGVVSTVDIQDVVCPNGVCPPKIDGIWIRSDGLHFTIPGAQWLAPALNQRLPQAV